MADCSLVVLVLLLPSVYLTHEDCLETTNHQCVVEFMTVIWDSTFRLPLQMLGNVRQIPRG